MGAGLMDAALGPCCSNLGGNALRGPLPARWRGLSNLERLILDNNRLSGTLPASWSSLTSLRTM